MDGLYFSKLN